MEFFVPGIESESTAHGMIDEVSEYAQEATEIKVLPGLADSLRFWRSGREVNIKVGGNYEGETVLCILNTIKGKMICTDSRGAWVGSPILVDHRDVIAVNWFMGHAPLQCV
jgi:hypothetical protein